MRRKNWLSARGGAFWPALPPCTLPQTDTFRPQACLLIDLKSTRRRQSPCVRQAKRRVIPQGSPPGCGALFLLRPAPRACKKQTAAPAPPRLFRPQDAPRLRGHRRFQRHSGRKPHHSGDKPHRDAGVGAVRLRPDQHQGRRDHPQYLGRQPRRARPVDEAAKARLAQRSVFCKRPPWRAAKIGKAQEARTATAASGRNREP